MSHELFEIGDLVADVRLMRHDVERYGIVIGFKPWRRTTLEEIATCPNTSLDQQSKIEYPEIYWLGSSAIETVMLQDIRNVPHEKISS